MGKKEAEFQSKLIAEIEERFPGSLAFKIETYLQGMPDLIVIKDKHWAALECKKNKSAKKQPNQDYYVELLNKMSFSRVIYPENKEVILDELQRSFESSK